MFWRKNKKKKYTGRKRVNLELEMDELSKFNPEEFKKKYIEFKEEHTCDNCGQWLITPESREKHRKSKEE